jgi:uncharacterized SAM-binding protein YcdF (DUF218 family)
MKFRIGRLLLGLGLVWGAWNFGARLLEPFMPPPQQILVLGGDLEREEVGAQLARRTRLPLLVSSGSNAEYARWLVARHGLSINQVKLDYRANDTLSNYTTLVDELRLQGVRHLLLVTSADHMDRALLVGRLVAGSRGIYLSPVPVPCGSNCQPEKRSKVWGDGFRALVWVFSGKDLRQQLQLHQAGH